MPIASQAISPAISNLRISYPVTNRFSPPRRRMRFDTRRAQRASRNDAYFSSNAGFDWNELRAETQALSLFAERRVLDVRLPTGEHGEGAELLQELVDNPPPDQLLLVSSGRLERQTLQSAWVKAFEQGRMGADLADRCRATA